MGPVIVLADAAPAHDDCLGARIQRLLRRDFQTFGIDISEWVAVAGERQHFVDPGLAARGDDRLGPPLDQDGHGIPLALGQRERVETARDFLGPAVGIQRLSDAPNVGGDIGQRMWSGHQVIDAGHADALDAALVTGHGQRGDDQVGFEFPHLFDVDVEIGADARQARDRIGRIIAVSVDAYQPVRPAKRTDDFGIRAGMGNDAHLASVMPAPVRMPGPVLVSEFVVRFDWFRLVRQAAMIYIRDDLLRDVSAVAQAADLDQRSVIGREFGNVVIVRELGKGSMGGVYIGYQKSLKRQVAVKLLPRLSGDVGRARRQFRDEAETVAVLSHPYIVPIFEMGEDEDYFFQVMQLVSGVDLGKMIRDRLKHPVISRRLLAPARVVDIVCKVLEGLAYAHREGVIHQDIKPANIMIDERAHRPLIVDFGIAKTARIEYWGRGLVVGSVLYLSPEQAAAQETDRRSDIYAMGMLLFEALAGRLPLREHENEKQTLIRKIKRPETLFTAAPSHCVPHIDEAMEKIILKALAPRREDRFTSCEAFRSSLLHWKSPGVQ